MPLPHEVRTLLWRVVNPSARRAVEEALEEWERANRTLTRLVLMGAHKIPLPARGGVWLAGLLGNPLASAAGGFLGGASILEAAVRSLERHYAHHGTLTSETRKHFEELVAGLARSSAPG
jgi:hypothetical protein